MTSRKNWHIVGVVFGTTISVLMIGADTWSADAGWFWSALMVILVVGIPLGSVAEIKSLRRSGRHDAADEVLRWLSAFAITLALIVSISSSRAEAIIDAELERARATD